MTHVTGEASFPSRGRYAITGQSVRRQGAMAVARPISAACSMGGDELPLENCKQRGTCVIPLLLHASSVIRVLRPNTRRDIHRQRLTRPNELYVCGTGAIYVCDAGENNKQRGP